MVMNFIAEKLKCQSKDGIFKGDVRMVGMECSFGRLAGVRRLSP
jgi:hypothetical protein